MELKYHLGSLRHRHSLRSSIDEVDFSMFRNVIEIVCTSIANLVT